MAGDDDNPSPDPWADLEAGDGGVGNDGFSFSFDAAEEPAAETPESADAFSFSLDEPAEPFAAPESLAPPELVASEEPPPPAPDVAAADGDDLAAAWLESPAPPVEFDVAPAAEVAEPVESSDDGFSFDAVHEPEDEPFPLTADAGEPAVPTGDDDLFSFVTGDQESAADVPAVDASLIGGSSSIEIGTGQSGIVSGSDIVPVDEPAPEQAGDFDFGAIAEESAAESFDFGEAVPVEAAEGAEEPAEEAGFGEALAVGAAAGAAVAAAAPKPSARATPRAKPAKQGGLGQMIGVVLGGLMALPITYAILVWGFGKDPFKFTKSVPPEFAFLLPAKFQPGFRSGGMPKIDRAPSLDALPPSDTAPTSDQPEEPSTDEMPTEPEAMEQLNSPVVEETEPDLGDLAVTPEPPPEPAAPPPPPPLDLSGVEAAIAAALDDIETVSLTDATDPARKKLLVGWYKKLAKVGEELALLETVAADTGRPLTEPPKQVAELYSRIADSDSLVDDIKRLCRDWVSYRKRPADGVMLVAILDDVRKVGPYWCSTLSLEQTDGTMKQVSVISRMEPKAAAGDRAVVSGVVFDDDVVWAADLRPLASAATEDLF